MALYMVVPVCSLSHAQLLVTPWTVAHQAPLFMEISRQEHWNRVLLLLLSRFSCIWLCDPIDGSPPGSPIPGILQARTLEWVNRVLFPPKRDLPDPRVKTESCISCFGRWIIYHWATGEAPLYMVIAYLFKNGIYWSVNLLNKKKDHWTCLKMKCNYFIIFLRENVAGFTSSCNYFTQL